MHIKLWGVNYPYLVMRAMLQTQYNKTVTQQMTTT